MSIEVTRKQHAVGQGFFHTGELRRDGVSCLRYVVDCGAMSKYAKARDERIARYIEFVGAKNEVDLLFISHAHADHLNGIPRLLDKKTGLRVGTVVMPFMEVNDRLMAFARAAVEDAPSSEDTYFRDYVADPVSAVAQFDPGRILLVRAGNRGDGAPFSNPDVEPQPADDPGPAPGNAESRRAWKLLGRGHPSTELSVRGGTSRVATIPDTLGFVSASPSGAVEWLLAPFVDPSIAVQKATFINALASAMGKTPPALRSWLRRKANVEKLLTAHVPDLRAAYETVERDLNVTSMCLYSGPAQRANAAQKRRLRGSFGTWNFEGDTDDNCAWMGTADAALKDKKRRGTFLGHYDRLLDQVATLTLPHHGSDHNFHPELLTRIQPAFCVAAADQFGVWRHPGSRVTQWVATWGKFLSVVTSGTRSEVFERVQLP